MTGRMIGMVALAAALAAPAQAEDWASQQASQQLLAQMESHQADAVAVRDPERPERFIAALRLPGQLLVDIIQPNRAIDSNYFSYTVVTSDGLSQTGVLTAETSTSVTLKQQEAKTLTIPRNQIEELRSDGISYMPDGLEKNIPPQDMADLIAFIKNWRYLKAAPAGGE